MTKVSSEINIQTGHLRYEIKMVFSGLQAGFVRSLILGHSHLFVKAFPPRQVNNIYFDTEDYQLQQAHIQGTHQRIKLRQRWYHATWSLSDSQIEIKAKSGNLGTKAIYPISTDADLSTISWKQLMQINQNSFPQNHHQIFGNTHPVLINSYQREYFKSADRSIRITLDTDLRSLCQTFGPRPNLTKPTPMHNVCVVEIKADAAYHLEIASVLKEFPQYCTAYSKYIHGTEILPL